MESSAFENLMQRVAERSLLDTIADNIHELRVKKGMSVRALSESAHVSRAGIYAWEDGVNMPTIRVLVRIAYALDTDVDTLFGCTSLRGSEECKEIKISSICSTALAERIGVSDSVVRKWAAGEVPHTKYVRKIADEFGCRVSDLCYAFLAQ